MEKEIEKIKELKELYDKANIRKWFILISDCKVKAKAIREKAEDGCERTDSRDLFICFSFNLCSTCQEIIKIAKEIEG